jgi:hypothetical protein
MSEKYRPTKKSMQTKDFLKLLFISQGLDRNITITPRRINPVLFIYTVHAENSDGVIYDHTDMMLPLISDIFEFSRSLDKHDYNPEYDKILIKYLMDDYYRETIICDLDMKGEISPNVQEKVLSTKPSGFDKFNELIRKMKNDPNYDPYAKEEQPLTHVAPPKVQTEFDKKFGIV